jgi:formate-dependent nitrite reductase membrane component NrfD
MVIKIMKLKEIFPLYFLMGFTGVIVAFYTGFLSSLITSIQDTKDMKENDEIK